MNRFHLISLIFFIGAIFLFIFGFLEGDVEGGIFIIFPFIAGSGFFALIGIVFFSLAILFYFFGFVNIYKSFDKIPFEKDEKSEKKPLFKGGGVVLVGPIPIVFGSSWKVALILMVLAILIIIFSFLFMVVV